MAINVLDKLANLRDNAFHYGESTSILSQLIVRRSPGRAEKGMPTKSIDVIISFLSLGERGATELATAQFIPTYHISWVSKGYYGQDYQTRNMVSLRLRQFTNISYFCAVLCGKSSIDRVAD